jgi:hypothetical protein
MTARRRPNMSKTPWLMLMAALAASPAAAHVYLEG